ncbi:MAG: hypothetical protein M0P91_08565 [Sulfuricurvum sp.]|jgi:hypothetical protein|uniref:hypothetical protein n=1 Tax=Sulfuricurvum sp. TaxID=2025608 RepID=UPI0025D766CB|nr:hypothetical protein [Sulfuricurvum sp.]MCK9373237.1 hypothetical protein [Sulfuricurvum sp.]
MEYNELITLQKYAAVNRLPIHTVIKKTMSGEFATVEKEENGKKKTYIVLQTSDSHQKGETSSMEKDTDQEVEIDYKKEYEALHTQYLILKTKYEKLLQTQSAD